ncbi:MAG: aspartate--tRNA(Asn) ligase, partial [Eubacterium sp.]|nr:aspartate--tRNA(Asn) ligase [Eubacterium sp.]
MKFMTGATEKEVLDISALLAGDYEGKDVKINGAIHKIRDMGDVAFIVLRKREGLVQTVYEEGVTNISLKDLCEETTVEVMGTVAKEERAPQGFEIRLKKVTILSKPTEPMPIAVNKWKM